jgi:hypothetical protein
MGEGVHSRCPQHLPICAVPAPSCMLLHRYVEFVAMCVLPDHGGSCHGFWKWQYSFWLDFDGEITCFPLPLGPQRHAPSLYLSETHQIPQCFMLFPGMCLIPRCTYRGQFSPWHPPDFPWAFLMVQATNISPELSEFAQNKSLLGFPVEIASFRSSRVEEAVNARRPLIVPSRSIAPLSQPRPRTSH